LPHFSVELGELAARKGKDRNARVGKSGHDLGVSEAGIDHR